ncbi:hypothetical protein HXX25_06525 [Hyphobacterium sp. CCMP332]|uniref:hypothetical protein n=1 Tax=Hyphobacterium sp. CCMP332 TaxID=2749086 RepID=UPI00165036D0|nr:hypothetical protein [Hyphobacterium sp. CCMP332]QNL19012.1 hypothetical protein HXX25_06525 [Hyphobacterium sp. CCMP332]
MRKTKSLVMPTHSSILAMVAPLTSWWHSPTRVTDQSGYTFLQIQCENANLSPIEGVNSVLVSIGSAPVPDILSIGATPSADGVVRIPETGNRISFLSAAAVNIGAGDGSAGAGEATVTASVDTGAASLPLTLRSVKQPALAAASPQEASTTSLPSLIQCREVFCRLRSGQW